MLEADERNLRDSLSANRSSDDSVQVLCRSNSSYAESPVAIVCQGVRHTVVAIQARWLLPDRKRFRVVVEGGEVLELDYCFDQDDWEVSAFFG